MSVLKNSYRHTYAISQRAAIDLSLSENPLGPSSKVIDAIMSTAGKAHLYPTDSTLIALIAKHHDVAENMILLGAGANELLEDYLKVFALKKSIVVPSATFPESVACMETLQGSVVSVGLNKNLGIDLDALLRACKPDTGLIHFCNPNNPTGLWTETSQLIQLAEKSRVPLLISEAGADFVGRTIIDRHLHSNIIVIRSLSKAYGLAGLRIGYSISSPEIVAKMKSNLRSYRVNSLAIAAAIAALLDQSYLQKSIAYLLKEKEWLMCEMNALGFQVVPSQGQTFLAHVPETYINASHFCDIAQQHDMAVVNCSLYPGLEKYIRVSPQKRATNKKYISILKKMQGGK